MNTLKHYIEANIFIIATIGAMLGLLLPFNLSSITIVIMILVWLLKDGFKGKFDNLKKNRKFLALSGFYLIYIVGLLYSDDTSRGFSILEKNVTLFILPIVFASSKPINLNKQYKLLSIFAFTNIIVGIFLLIFASIQYFKTGSSSFFYYDKLTAILDFHPVYLAMYVLFSMVIIFYGYIHKRIILKPIFFFLTMVLAVVLLVFLSSKMVLAISAVILLYFMFSEIKNKKVKTISMVIFLLFFATAIFSFATTKKRIKEVVNSEWSLITKDHYAYNDAFTGLTLRIITWKIAIKHMFNEENVLIGTAPADSQDFLDNVYAKYGMDAAGYTGYNLHNQYIEIFVKSGFIGLILFLIWIVIFFKEAIARKKVYFFFLVIFFTMALTESNLEVHRGIVFFALFNSLFFFCEPDKA